MHPRWLRILSAAQVRASSPPLVSSTSSDDRTSKTTPNHTGFKEGAKAGFEYGLARGALQALTAHLQPSSAAAPLAANLQKELNGVTPKVAMARACLEILATRPVDIEAKEGEEELAAALAQLALQQPAAAAEAAATAAAAAASSSGGGGAEAVAAKVHGESWRRYIERLTNDLSEMGCDVGAAPPVPARAQGGGGGASTSSSAAAAARGGDGGGGKAGAAGKGGGKAEAAAASPLRRSKGPPQVVEVDKGQLDELGW